MKSLNQAVRMQPVYNSVFATLARRIGPHIEFCSNKGIIPSGMEKGFSTV
jgi:hypothetical protein